MWPFCLDSTGELDRSFFPLEWSPAGRLFDGVRLGCASPRFRHRSARGGFGVEVLFVPFPFFRGLGGGVGVLGGAAARISASGGGVPEGQWGR
ncbi:unnamed protein product [Linum trigynum]|uniref:Uncharacterized protein n=1 Tax=Linum trigynum TaxID=586398 RepID=A0AAV2FCG5_9ROSI